MLEYFYLAVRSVWKKTNFANLLRLPVFVTYIVSVIICVRVYIIGILRELHEHFFSKCLICSANVTY